MASHHKSNAVGVSAAVVDGPGSPSSTVPCNVKYTGAPAELDTPGSDYSVSKVPNTPDGSIEVDGPNTPDPMSSNGPTTPSY